MVEWKEYKLGEVCNTISDTYKGNAENVVLINTSDVLEGKCLNHIKTPNKDLKGQFKKTFQKDDILYSEIRPANKRYAYIDFDATDYIASTKLMVIRHNERILPQYLFYKLKNQAVLDELQMLAESRSGTFPQITFSEVANLEIKLPPIEQQHRILGILKSLDDKIEVNRKINENLEQQAQALFKSWFVDFEPFKDGEFVESELGMIPKGWKLKRIYEYVDVIYGAPYKSSLFNDNKEGLPLIRIRDLKTNTPQFYTPEILPNTEYIKAGDIVAGMDAEFTPYVWQGERGVLNQRCCKFKGKYEGISNYYILFLVKPELEYVQSYKTGTTVSHLGKSDIDRFVFLTPPLDIVLAFSEIVNPMIKEVVNRANEARRLASLRDTLLPKLMSGEIKVNDMQLSENQ